MYDVILFSDGSAVEIVGLSYAVLLWLDQLHSDGLIMYSGVRTTLESETYCLVVLFLFCLLSCF